MRLFCSYCGMVLSIKEENKEYVCPLCGVIWHVFPEDINNEEESKAGEKNRHEGLSSETVSEVVKQSDESLEASCS